MYNTIVFSINVFEGKKEKGRWGNHKLNYYYLKEQILNIKYNTTDFTEVYVILNCNDQLFDRLQNEPLYDDKIKIIVNPEIINKKRFTGTLSHGIFSNLKYIVENKINFDYFIVISSRNVFKTKISMEIINNHMIHTKTKWLEMSKLNRKFYFNPSYGRYDICDGTTEPGYRSYNSRNLHKLSEPTPQWYFKDKRVKETSWFHKFKKEFDFLIGGKHEALCFTYNVIKNMYNYMINNNEIMNEIYNSKCCIEEIIPQTLGYNLRNNKEDTSFTFLPELILLPRDIDKLKLHNKKFKK